MKPLQLAVLGVIANSMETLRKVVNGYLHIERQRGNTIGIGHCECVLTCVSMPDVSAVHLRHIFESLHGGGAASE